MDDSSFRAIDENVIPYACLVDYDTGITKNGQLFQVIKIDLDDFRFNQEDGVRDHLRKVLADISGESNLSFWIHTIKRRKKYKSYNETVKNTFLNYINKEHEEKASELNNFSTILYVSIFLSGVRFTFNPLNLAKQITNFLLIRSHNAYIEKGIESLHRVSKKIISDLESYNPRLLSYREENAVRYSELIEFLAFCINYDETPYPIEEIDISRMINSSKYHFSNGVFIVHNEVKKKNQFASCFSCKEVPIIPVSVIADILSIQSELVISEYISYIDEKVAKRNFNEQIGLMKISGNKEFIESSGLGFLPIDVKSNEKAMYCQSSISFTFIARYFNELTTCINDAIDMFSKYGIVAVREDISSERTFYASIPGNFSFVHRQSIHDANEIGTFAYSYTPKDQNEDKFLFNRSLLRLGTLKNNPVSFGIQKDKKNILIAGPVGSGKTVFANFLSSRIASVSDYNIYTIETISKSHSFTEAIGGVWHHVSLNRQKNTLTFNPLVLQFKDASDRGKYLTEFFSLLLAFTKATITNEILADMNNIISKINSDLSGGAKLALHDIRSYLKDTHLEQEIQSWHSIGKYYHLFDNREDTINNANNICFYLDETIQADDVVLSVLVNHILTGIIEKVRAEIANNIKKQTVIIIQEPFFCFYNSFFKNKIDTLIELAEKYGIILIFTIEEYERESATIVDFRRLIASCETQIHFGNKLASDKYGKTFDLAKTEYLAVRTLASYQNAFLLKFDKNVLSCRFDLSRYPEILKILSDNEEIRSKILSVKESIQTEDPNRWVEAFCDHYKNEGNNNAMQDLERDMQAIKDVNKIINT